MTSLLMSSAFRIRLFDADIQIPETWMQALLPFSRPASRAPRRACSQASSHTKDKLTGSLREAQYCIQVK